MGGASAHLGNGSVLCTFLPYATWICCCWSRSSKVKKKKKKMKCFSFRSAGRRSPRQPTVLQRSVSVPLKKKNKVKSADRKLVRRQRRRRAVTPQPCFYFAGVHIKPRLNIYSGLKVLPIWIQSNALLFPPKADYLWIFGLTSEPKGLKQFT